MKLTTAEQQQAYTDATIEGGIKGSFIGVGIATSAHLILSRRLAYYRALPLSVKTFGLVACVVPAFSIGAEKAGEAYSRTQWTGIGKRELDLEEQREQQRWEQLGTWDQVGDWAKRRKWPIIGASWATAMVGSFAAVNRNKYQSFSQKLVQARVYAQAWTIGIMLVAALVQGTGIANTDTVELRQGDHSWREILEQEGYKKQLEEQRSTQLADAKRTAQPQRGA